MRLKITRYTPQLYPKRSKRNAMRFGERGKDLYNVNLSQYFPISLGRTVGKQYFVNTDDVYFKSTNTWTGSGSYIVTMSADYYTNSPLGNLEVPMEDPGENYDYNTFEFSYNYVSLSLLGNSMCGKVTSTATSVNDYLLLPSSSIQPFEGDFPMVYSMFLKSDGEYGNELSFSTSSVTHQNILSYSFTQDIINGNYLYITSSANFGAKWYTGITNISTSSNDEYRILMNVVSMTGNDWTVKMINAGTPSGSYISNTTHTLTTGRNYKVFKLNTSATSSVHFEISSATSGSSIYINPISIKRCTKPDITFNMGNITKTYTSIPYSSDSFVECTLNITSSNDISGSGIKIYSSFPTTFYIDTISLLRLYDFSGVVVFNPNQNFTGSGTIAGMYQRGDLLKYDGANKRVTLSFAGTSLATATNSVLPNRWHMAAYSINRRTNMMHLYINGVLLTSASLENALNPAGWYSTAIGSYYYAQSDVFEGYIGDIQYIKYNNILESNFNPSRYMTEFYTPTGGGALKSAWIKFIPNRPYAINIYYPKQPFVGSQINSSYITEYQI